MKPAQILGPDGPFEQKLAGFSPREDQRVLAGAIHDCIRGQETLIAEAGTGVGKTYAYLVAVIAAGERSIISTGTRTLQDQLFHRDVPAVLEVMAVGLRTALLKGRSNYLCRYRLERTRTSGDAKRYAADLEGLHEWSYATESGDLSEFPALPDNAAVRPLVTSTADNCLGRHCPDIDECFVFKARRAAQAADLVIVNHHLLFADFALKEGGYGSLLPDVRVYVLDEAHQIPETAARYFGTSVSRARLSDLVRDAKAEAADVAGVLAGILEPADALRASLEIFREALEDHPERGPWQPMLAVQPLQTALRRLIADLQALAAGLRSVAESSTGLESCARRAAELTSALEKHAAPALPGEVHWYERRGRGFLLHATPIEVAEPFGALRSGIEASWIFTSATLAVGESFALYQRQLGLEEAATLRLVGPFDYQNQALLYLPTSLPPPGSQAHSDAVYEICLDVLPLTHGRAFVLFTSHRALNHVARRLRRDGRFPLFVQGEAPRTRLLEEFVASGNGVLLGAASFWEGVDVPGAALSCVIVDKLPFAAPDDPVVQARSDALRRAGASPFTELHLPQTALALKQGIGRLIRGISDCGLAVICDPRLTRRGYGARIRSALPPMPVTDDLSEVATFCHATISDVRAGSSILSPRGVTPEGAD